MIRSFFNAGYPVMIMAFLTGVVFVVKTAAAIGINLKIRNENNKLKNNKEIHKVINTCGKSRWINVCQAVEIYVDKLILEVKILGISLSTVDKTGGQAAVISLIFTAAACFLGLSGVCGQMIVLSTAGVGVISILILLLVDKTFELERYMERYEAVLKLTHIIEAVENDIYINNMENEDMLQGDIYALAAGTEKEDTAEQKEVFRNETRRERSQRMKRDKKEIYKRLKEEEKKSKNMKKLAKGQRPEELETEALENMRRNREERKRQRRERTLEYMRQMDYEPYKKSSETDNIYDNEEQKDIVINGAEKMNEAGMQHAQCEAAAAVKNISDLRKIKIENERSGNESRDDELEQIIKDFFNKGM